MRRFAAGFIAGLLAALMIASPVQSGRHNCRPAWKCAPPTQTITPTVGATLAVTQAPTVAPTLAPPPTPAPTVLPATVYGPAIAADGKDNRWIGMSSAAAQLPKREVAHRWISTGGQMTAYAYNQRTGSGYSEGDGGTVELSLYRCDPTPTGSALSTTTHLPGNPGGEVKTPIPWSATVPAGMVCVVHRNLAPPGNFISANELWAHDPDSPRQPAFPDDSMAVLSRNEFGSSWSVVQQNTPVFDATFADGHHEGQAYHERFVSPQEILVSGSTRVRERFTPTQTVNVSEVWFRVQRRSGTGLLTVSLAGQTATATIGHVSLETQFNSAVWVGGEWVRIPLSASLPANVEQTLTFSVPPDTVIRVAPIRETFGQSNPFWGSRQFRDGVAEKSVSGGAWEPMYFGGVADLQVYVQ